jgi:hypothetical protein
LSDISSDGDFDDQDEEEEEEQEEEERRKNDLKEAILIPKFKSRTASIHLQNKDINNSSSLDNLQHTTKQSEGGLLKHPSPSKMQFGREKDSFTKVKEEEQSSLT